MRDINHRIRRVVVRRVVLADVRRQTDDGGPLVSERRACRRSGDALPDRILVPEVRGGQSLVDDGHLAPGTAVVGIERTTADERTSSASKTGGRRSASSRSGAFPWPRWLTVNSELSRSAAEEGLVGRHSCAYHRTDRVQALFHAPHEVHARLTSRIFSRWQDVGHREQARGVKTDIAPVHVEEAAHHESRACQQDQRERQFGDDQCRSPTARSQATDPERPLPSALHSVGL